MQRFDFDSRWSRIVPEDDGDYVLFSDAQAKSLADERRIAELEDICRRLLTSECFKRPTHGIWLELADAVMPIKNEDH